MAASTSAGVEPINRAFYEFPCNLLLQYSYFLNVEACKEITIGYDPYSFVPSVYLTWMDEGSLKYLHLCRDSWIFFRDCLGEIKDNFTGNVFNAEQYRATSSDGIWELEFRQSCFVNGENGFELRNTAFSLSLYFNFTEIKTLFHLTIYCAAIMVYYGDVQKIVESYYDQYLLVCYANGRDYLDYHEYIRGNDTVKVNWFRVFSEIPIVCKNKLRKDLNDLRT